MKKQSPLKKFTGSLTPISVHSPVQSLVNLEASSPWEHSIIFSKKLRNLSHNRRKLITKLERIFRLVQPVDMDFGKALKLKLVQEWELASLYRDLIKFLNEEEYSERLLLYFPIELIPGGDWNMSGALKRVADNFVEVYVRTWHMLLLRQDIRANFIDGDIPEIEIRTGPLPKVVKAAHLIPALVSKGILSYNNARIMADECSGLVLRTSIEEILPYCADSVPTMEHKTTQKDSSWLITRIKQAEGELRSLEIPRMLTNMPASRVHWETERDQKLCIDTCARDIAQALVETSITIQDLESLIGPVNEQYRLLVIILALQYTLESVAKADLIYAKNIYATYTSLLENLWGRKKLSIQDSLECLWAHLFNFGIIDQTALDEHGIQIPAFDANARMSSASYDMVCAIVRVLQSHTELRSLVMPVAIAYGSQVKGYSTERADNDIAVFIRPHVDIARRNYVQELLSKLLGSVGFTGKVLEFWTEESASLIKILDFDNPDRMLGDSTLTHVLFGGVWFGDRDMLRSLYRNILAPYLFSKDTLIDSQPIREFWLEEMERDALQYRLMHRGYYRFFPKRMTRSIPVGMIDSGAFWDSGYRRLATKLFLKKVFLPRLTQEK